MHHNSNLAFDSFLIKVLALNPLLCLDGSVFVNLVLIVSLTEEKNHEFIYMFIADRLSC